VAKSDNAAPYRPLRAGNFSRIHPSVLKRSAPDSGQLKVRLYVVRSCHIGRIAGTGRSMRERVSPISLECQFPFLGLDIRRWGCYNTDTGGRSALSGTTWGIGPLPFCKAGNG
jgi:hypothetical protein